MGEYSGGSRNSSALEVGYNKAYIDITSCIKQLGLVYKFDEEDCITKLRQISKCVIKQIDVYFHPIQV